MAKVYQEKTLKQVMAINIGFRPGINFLTKTAGTVGDPDPFGARTDYPYWYQRGAKIPGAGLVWNKYSLDSGAAMDAALGQKPTQDKVGGEWWERYYYFLREAIGGGAVNTEGKMLEGAAPQVLDYGKEGAMHEWESSKKFLKNKDPAMRMLGKQMMGASGILTDWSPTKLGEEPHTYYPGEKKLKGRGKAISKVTEKKIVGLSDSAIPITGITGGAQNDFWWRQYPTGVATKSFVGRRIGLQLTFDELRRTSSAPVQSILKHFLAKIVGKAGELPPAEEVEIGTGSTFDEQLISLLPQSGGGGSRPTKKKLGRALKDLSTEDGYAPGHRIDMKFTEEVTLTGKGGTSAGFQKADVTSSYFHSQDHHGVGTGHGMRKYLIRGDRAKDGKVQTPIIDMVFLRNHFRKRIKAYNTILKLLYKSASGSATSSALHGYSGRGAGGTMAEKRKRAVYRHAPPGQKLNVAKTLRDALKALATARDGARADVFQESDASLLKTVEWMLHHMGDAIAGGTYANIMPIRFNHSDGTLIFVAKLKDDGTFYSVQDGGSTVTVMDHGLAQTMLNLSNHVKDGEAQRATLQNAIRAFTMAGYRGVRSSQVTMNQINLLTTAEYAVSYAVPVDDDVKDILYDKFMELTQKGVLSNEAKKAFKTKLTNIANTYSGEFQTGVEGRLGYSGSAAKEWLSSGHGSSMGGGYGSAPKPSLEHILWAQPFMTVEREMEQRGGGSATQPRGRLRQIDNKTYVWDIWYQKKRGEQIQRTAK